VPVSFRFGSIKICPLKEIDQINFFYDLNINTKYVQIQNYQKYICIFGDFKEKDPGFLAGVNVMV